MMGREIALNHFRQVLELVEQHPDAAAEIRVLSRMQAKARR